MGNFSQELLFILVSLNRGFVEGHSPADDPVAIRVQFCRARLFALFDMMAATMREHPELSR
jgi:hypothetical protein